MNALLKEHCPICDLDWPSSAMETHHIIERAESRALGEKVENRAWNLIRICGADHNLVSAGEIITERKVMTTDGIKLMWKRKDDSDWTFS